MWVFVSGANFQYSKVPGLPHGTPTLVASYQLGPSAVPELCEERIGLVKTPAAFSG